MNHSVKPEDVLPDGVDSTIINGKSVRKGTIAAFLSNADIYENKNATPQQKQNAMNMLKELAPGVITIGLHKHVVFKNPMVEQVLIDAEND